MSMLYKPTSFPRVGAYSLGGYTPPSNAGIVPVTELRNLLDDTWARDATQRASAAAATLQGRGQTLGSCLTSTGLFNADGSGLGFGAGPAFSLSGLGSVLGASADSVAGVIGDLQMALGMQSLAAGLARSISSAAGSIFGLLDRALSATGPAAQHLVNLASGLVGLAGRAVDLFSGAFQLAGRGLLALGEFSPGEVFSGMAGKLQSMLGNIGGSVLALAGDAAALAGQLAAAGIDALLSPSATLGKLAGLFSPIAGALSGIGKGIGDALSKLNADTLAKVASKIGESLAGAVGALADGIASAASALAGKVMATFERFQGVTLIDGDWKNGFRLSRASSLGLSSLLGLLSAKSKGKFAKGVSSASAVGILLATVLGNSAPVKGSFLVTENGWLGSAAGAIGSISASLAEACAFNAAMAAALRGFLGAGTSAIDALMASLECRRGTYSKVQSRAAAEQNRTEHLLRQMLALWRAITGGQYPAICPASPYGLGRCA